MKKTLFSALTALALCASGNMQAQTIIAASNPDNQITFSGTTDARTLNCDMIFHPNSGGTLRAIAYDDHAATNSYIYLEDHSGGTVTIPISNAINPDVVLGDDMNNPGTDYIAGVVYMNALGIFFDTYVIYGTGSSTLTYAPVSSVQVSFGSSDFEWPHIDLYPDVNSNINGLFAYHNFAITWAENVTLDVHLVDGDLNTPTTFNNTYNITTTGIGKRPDVACLWDFSTNEAYAYVSFVDVYTNDLHLAEVNLTAATFLVNWSVGAGPVDDNVRIEAMNAYLPWNGFQKYQIVYATNGTPDMYTYNDIAANTDISSALLAGDQHMYPAVCAGQSPLLNGGPCNDNYFMAWCDVSSNMLYARNSDITTGTPGGGYIDYYEVNQSSVTLPAFINPSQSPVAIGTSCNRGEEVLTAWVSNNDIWYKHNSFDISQYKPSNVNVPAKAAFRLYPNPATGRITIESPARADYTISDVTGRVLKQGALQQGSNVLDVHALAAGMYVASVKENSKTSLIKFTKE